MFCRDRRREARLRELSPKTCEPLEPRFLLAVITVTNTTDVIDGSITSVASLNTSPGADGISLREAITAANNDPDGPNEIRFNIPGPGPHTVLVTSALPPLSNHALVIDGTTEPDFAGTLMIELNGGLGAYDGLQINGSASGSAIRGLVINRFGHSGVEINASNDNVIEGNYIGTDLAGTAPFGNRNYGVSVVGNRNRVGGTSAAARNIISGNALSGVFVSGLDNVIQGNYIGTDAGGAVAIPNSSGISVIGPTQRTLIGGDSAPAANVISGNTVHGIDVVGAGQIRIHRNAIGIGADGITPLGNLVHGINLDGSDGSIGDDGAENVIAHNGGNGITLNNSGSLNFRYNSIHSNSGIGIDLGNDGVTLNDQNDGDSGPNERQNFPVLTSAVRVGSRTIISGTLNTNPNSAITLVFYSSPEVDPSGHGEGQTHFATFNMRSDNAGNLRFSWDVPVALRIGEFVTALADRGGITSEFSQAIQVLEQPNFTVADLTVNESNAGTVNAVFTVWRTGNTSSPSSLIYSTANGTAEAPGDYAPFSAALLTFAPGEVSKNITVPVRGDTTFEQNETFFLNLSSPVNGVIADAQAQATIVNDDPDNTPPMVLTSNFAVVGTLPRPYEVSFELSEPVIGPPTGVPLLVRRIDNGQLVATVMASIESGNLLRGRLAYPLADGNYRATLPSGAVTDLAGNLLLDDVDLHFFILAGDLNLDRAVSIADFLTLASHFGQSPATFSEGDVNYDNTVSIADFLALAANFGRSLPAAPVRAGNSQISAGLLGKHSVQPRAREADRRRGREVWL